MPTDPYSTYAAGPAGPAQKIDRDSGVVASFVGLPAGTILPIRVARVMSTGTSAASLVGMA
jgi:hypothetical protein